LIDRQKKRKEISGKHSEARKKRDQKNNKERATTEGHWKKKKQYEEDMEK